MKHFFSKLCPDHDLSSIQFIVETAVKDLQIIISTPGDVTQFLGDKRDEYFFPGPYFRKYNLTKVNLLKGPFESLPSCPVGLVYEVYLFATKQCLKKSVVEFLQHQGVDFSCETNLNRTGMPGSTMQLRQPSPGWTFRGGAGSKRIPKSQFLLPLPGADCCCFQRWRVLPWQGYWSALAERSQHFFHGAKGCVQHFQMARVGQDWKSREQICFLQWLQPAAKEQDLVLWRNCVENFGPEMEAVPRRALLGWQGS